MMTQDDNGGSYELMAGPDISMSEDVAVTRSDEMVFASHTIPSSWWTVWGVRPSAGDEASVWLYGDDAYTIGTLAVSDQTGPGVAFVVGDYNHIGSGSTVYPRFWRRSGTGALDMEFEGGGETLSYTPGDANSYDLTWPAGDVAEIWDVYLSDGDQVRFRLEDLSGGMNLGMALFASNGAAYYAPEEAANLLLDGVGPGGDAVLDLADLLLELGVAARFHQLHLHAEVFGLLGDAVIDREPIGVLHVREGDADFPGLRCLFERNVAQLLPRTRHVEGRVPGFDLIGIPGVGGDRAAGKRNQQASGQRRARFQDTAHRNNPSMFVDALSIVGWPAGPHKRARPPTVAHSS